MTVTIDHTPDCGTSRNTLTMIQWAELEPQIIEYLKTPPTRERLIELLTQMGLPPCELLRQKGTPYDQLGLGNEQLSDDELIDDMIANPLLINRPIVVGPRGARLCRPSELILELLENLGTANSQKKMDKKFERYARGSNRMALNAAINAH